MKIKKIRKSALEIRKATIPYCSEFLGVKLDAEKALTFNPAQYSSFDELLKKVSPKEILHPQELYEGYLAFKSIGGRIEVVHMHGRIQKISSVGGIINPDFAEKVKQGQVWGCVFPYKGKICSGLFNYVWLFQGMVIADWIRHNPSMKIDPEETDQIIKDKLCRALIAQESLELSTDENSVLSSYLGHYYKEFFEY